MSITWIDSDDDICFGNEGAMGLEEHKAESGCLFASGLLDNLSFYCFFFGEQYFQNILYLNMDKSSDAS